MQFLLKNFFFIQAEIQTKGKNNGNLRNHDDDDHRMYCKGSGNQHGMVKKGFKLHVIYGYSFFARKDQE